MPDPPNWQGVCVLSGEIATLRWRSTTMFGQRGSSRCSHLLKRGKLSMKTTKVRARIDHPEFANPKLYWSITALVAVLLTVTTGSHATPRDQDEFHAAWQAMTEQLEKDVKASNPDVVEIRLAGNTLILGTKEPRPTESDWRAMETAPNQADAWPHYVETACHSKKLRSYLSKGFKVVFRLYDTTGNLRVTYAPVNIGACAK
jgi:hypothetical protein